MEMNYEVRNICDKASYCLSNIYNKHNPERYFIELLDNYITEYKMYKMNKSTIPNMMNRLQNIIDCGIKHTELNTYIQLHESKLQVGDEEQLSKFCDYLEIYRKDNSVDMYKLSKFISKLDVKDYYNVLTTVEDMRESWKLVEKTSDDNPRVGRYPHLIPYILDEIKEKDRNVSIKSQKNYKFSLKFPVEIYILILLSCIESKYEKRSIYYMNEEENKNLKENFDISLDTIIIQLNKVLEIDTQITINRKRRERK